MLSISDVINMSKYLSDYKGNLRVFTTDKIETIEKPTMGQSKNEHWFEYCKCLITASKAHDVTTKMTKVEKGGGGKACDPWARKYQHWPLLSQIFLLQNVAEI